ncbi:MAG: transcriptional regulator GcvA [Gammaproteobacteria bacterium]|nr:transcriptional regulator GcvA [Gammaproteobacteria bacterium]
MSKKLPPLNWLRSFEAAARHLNFTQAAEELCVTQAAVSKHVKNLEHQLDVELFVRLPSGLRLSSAGAAYLPSVRDAIDDLIAATDALFSFSGHKSLHIHASLIFFRAWLAPRLHTFMRLQPEVDLRFTSSIWVDEHEMLENIDLEIRYGDGNWPNVFADRLTWDRLLPVCSPTLLERGPTLSTPEDLLQHTLLHVAGYEHGWHYWLHHVLGDEVNIGPGIQFDTLIAALGLAEQGVGIALGRSSLVSGMIEQGRLCAPLSEQMPTDESFYVVCAQRPHPGSDAAKFRDWLIAVAQAERQTGE